MREIAVLISTASSPAPRFSCQGLMEPISAAFGRRWRLNPKFYLTSCQTQFTQRSCYQTAGGSQGTCREPTLLHICRDNMQIPQKDPTPHNPACNPLTVR